jgi:hypothetical protein
MIFVSHAREDAAVARALAAELVAAGLPCFIDPSLPQGDVFWRDALIARLASCRLMASVWSPAADASPWVQQERRWFAASGIEIVVDARGDSDAVHRIARAYDGPRGPAALASSNLHEIDGDCGVARTSLHEAGERRQWEAVARGCQARPRFDGVQAWLADGRIALVRVTGSPDGQYVATRPLSNALYREFLAAEPAFPPPPTWARAGWDADDLPVTGVTWFEAAACARWFGGRLPSEAAWHWAACGGGENRNYATATGRLAPSLAHFGAAFGEGMPVPAGTYAATPEGFDGLCGNTWDWCSDAAGPFHVIRGGGWMDDAVFCRTGARYRHAPVDRDACVGLRLALDQPRS